MSMTSEEFWMGEARKFENWFYRANYERAQQETENAELRELVLAAWKCIHSGLCCSDCRLVAGGCTLQSAMRELGIEVSNAD